ncbi:MAG: hypothetical protein GY832_40730 [Chloroflexi bacterium]|nr:hypothetical protein [Chloroflexota bacterium]
MSIPLLKTKLYIPHVRPELVSRPRLIERLDESIHSAKLTLIAAPAGYGKTTLLVEWLAGYSPQTHPVAWLSLDAGDSDPTRFWVYVIAALQTLAPELGASVLPQIQSAQPPPMETLMTLLINDIATHLSPDGPRSVLVLDDYHLVAAPAIHQALAFWIDNFPPAVTLGHRRPRRSRAAPAAPARARPVTPSSRRRPAFHTRGSHAVFDTIDGFTAYA